MEYTFKQHKLSDAEKLWLIEAANPSFDPRVAKVRLRDKLPADFRPGTIDQRLLAGRHLTLIGLWHVDPDDVRFQALDSAIQAVRAAILKDPTRKQVTSVDVAEASGLDEAIVARTMWYLGQFSGFFSSASGPEGSYNTMSLEGDDAFDEYLRYTDIDDLLERTYVARARPQSLVLGGTLSAPIFSLDDAQSSGVNVLGLDQTGIARNTAFVLMAIDPNNGELEDAYTAITEAFAAFDIKAIRADKVEHQGQITELVLNSIRSCEYLLADLSGERPNVYYEVGFAHALHKHPILFRRKDTKVHFDLSIHNVPEYRSATELRALVRARLEAVTGRRPKSG